MPLTLTGRSYLILAVAGAFIVSTFINYGYFSLFSLMTQGLIPLFLMGIYWKLSDQIAKQTRLEERLLKVEQR